jgi:hypothetical protein
MKEVEDMGLEDLAVMHEAAYLFRHRCQAVTVSGPDKHIHSLGRCQMMTDRADAAESLDQDRCLPKGATADKAFKAAKLDNMETAFRDLMVIIQVDGDLAVPFNPGDRFNSDFLCHNGISAPIPGLLNQI